MRSVHRDWRAVRSNALKSLLGTEDWTVEELGAPHEFRQSLEGHLKRPTHAVTSVPSVDKLAAGPDEVVNEDHWSWAVTN